ARRPRITNESAVGRGRLEVVAACPPSHGDGRMCARSRRSGCPEHLPQGARVVVVLRKTSRLLSRHPALHQGLPEPLDASSPARWHLLRKNGEDLLHILRLHLVSLFPVFRHSFTWWFLVPEQAGPCIWGNRALVTTSRR